MHGLISKTGEYMIYFDSAATTLKKPQVVIDAVVRAMNEMGNAGRGVHDASLDAARVIFETRRKIADFFHAAGPRQVAFTANATESLNLAVKGLLMPGDHVITTELEHNSVLRPLYELEQEGIQLSFVKSDRKGCIREEDFENLILPHTRMIVCTHGSNVTGNLVAIEKIGELTASRGILFVVDASQTVGIFPIDMERMNIDVLCFTGHKSLMGPQGTGGICVREGLKIRPLKTGGSGVQSYRKEHPAEMPTALEAGTLNGHGIAGLGAAIDFLQETGIDRIRKREQQLMWRFYDGVKELPGVTVYGDFLDKNRCPMVSMNLADYDSAEVADELYQIYGISVRAGAHCAPLMHKALGTQKQGAVRFSFSYYNTEDEVDAAVQAIHDMIRESEG